MPSIAPFHTLDRHTLSVHDHSDPDRTRSKGALKDMTTPQVQAVQAETPAFAKTSGIIGLILAIVAVFIPIVGVLFITPLAIIAGIIALYGNCMGFGIAILIINVVNLMISPTFWANIGAGASFEGAAGNRALTYFDVIGVIVMLFLAVRPRRTTEGVGR
jgi:hypothetical protein